MDKEYTLFQMLTLFGSVFLGFASIVLWHGFRKYKAALIVLIAAAGLIRFSITVYDPYLNLWDERYHAVVAKNMIDDPFKPMLYSDPVLPYNMEHWNFNHIWLHKPPLFLWQMSLSMKIFGLNEFGLRFPGALLSLLTVLLIYSLARRWLNKHIAFYAALLYTFTSYILDLVSGYHHSEQNDTVFIFYVTLSLWAWTRHIDKRRWYWIVLIGLSAGAAVMVKWMSGLAIFGVWGIVILCSPDLRKRMVSYLEIAIAFIISLVVFMPWEIYTRRAFPAEHAFEAMEKTRHFLEPVEGHFGDAFWHFNKLDIIYAAGVKILLIPALILLWRRLKRVEIKLGFILFFSLIFVFYSIAETKMPAFTLPGLAVVYMGLGTVFYELFLLFRVRYKRLRYIGRISAIVLLTASIFWFLNVDHIKKLHTCWKYEQGVWRKEWANSPRVFKEINEKDFPKGTVFINLREFDHAQMMFYTDFTAYSGIPNDENMEILKESGRQVVAFDNHEIEDFYNTYPWVIRYDEGYWNVFR